MIVLRLNVLLTALCNILKLSMNVNYACVSCSGFVGEQVVTEQPHTQVIQNGSDSDEQDLDTSKGKHCNNCSCFNGQGACDGCDCDCGDVVPVCCTCCELLCSIFGACVPS